jgi:hypothetical protein
MPEARHLALGGGGLPDHDRVIESVIDGALRMLNWNAALAYIATYLSLRGPYC